MKKLFGMLMCVTMVAAFAIGCGDTKKKVEKKEETKTTETKDTTK